MSPDLLQVQKGCYCILQGHNPSNAAPSTSLEPMKLPSQKMYVISGRRKHGDEIPWQCSCRSSGELSGRFDSKCHIFMCGAHIVPTCSCECSVELLPFPIFLGPDVIDHMKQGSDLHMFVVVLVLFPCLCNFGGVHVFAPRNKADIVREIVPGLSNMLRPKDD